MQQPKTRLKQKGIHFTSLCLQWRYSPVFQLHPQVFLFRPLWLLGAINCAKFSSPGDAVAAVVLQIADNKCWQRQGRQMWEWDRCWARGRGPAFKFH